MLWHTRLFSENDPSADDRSTSFISLFSCSFCSRSSSSLDYMQSTASVSVWKLNLKLCDGFEWADGSYSSLELQATCIYIYICIYIQRRIQKYRSPGEKQKEKRPWMMWFTKNESVTETRRVQSLPKSALPLRPFLMKYMAHEIGPDALKGPEFIFTCSDSIPRNTDPLIHLAAFILSRLPPPRSVSHKTQIKRRGDGGKVDMQS